MTAFYIYPRPLCKWVVNARPGMHVKCISSLSLRHENIKVLIMLIRNCIAAFPQPIGYQ